MVHYLVVMSGFLVLVRCIWFFSFGLIRSGLSFVPSGSLFHACVYHIVRVRKRGKALRVIPRGKQLLTVYRAQQVFPSNEDISIYSRYIFLRSVLNGDKGM